VRLALLAILLSTAAAHAQAPQDRAHTEADAIAADSRARALRRDADAADIKARRARFEAITLARHIQDGERRATAIEGRMRQLSAVARRQRAQLAARQDAASRLLAAVLTMSRRPAALVLLEPSSAITTARVSALLGAIRPELRRRTRRLAEELAATQRLTQRLATANRQLVAVQRQLATDIRALDALQASERARRDTLDAAADAEKERARMLARQAIDLRGLARGVERRSAAQRGAPVYLAPAAKNQSYRLPASGQVQSAFGARLAGPGGTARGLTLATRANAQVTAPATGRVAYAGPFRDYGEIVIVEHDTGLLSLVAGLERVDVVIGEAVRVGTPIGRMGAGEPELYLELREHGRPVDPMRRLQARQ
jgi:septal ring factor EnvC (AmiA/AmiB activator)